MLISNYPIWWNYTYSSISTSLHSTHLPIMHYKFFTWRIDNSVLELLSAVSLNFIVHSTVLYTRHHMYTLCLIYSEGSKKGNKLERTQTCSFSPYSLSSLQCSMKFVPYIFHWSILSFLATLCSSLADRYIEQYCSVYLYNVQFHTTELNALMLSHPSIDLFVALTCSHIFSPLCSSPHSLVHSSSYTN